MCARSRACDVVRPLRKNLDDRHCPDCGLSVWMSLNANDSLDYSNAAWLEGVARGVGDGGGAGGGVGGEIWLCWWGSRRRRRRRWARCPPRCDIRPDSRSARHAATTQPADAAASQPSSQPASQPGQTSATDEPEWDGEEDPLLGFGSPPPRRPRRRRGWPGFTSSSRLPGCPADAA